MGNGWTGGQYSVYRAVFGLYLLVTFARLLPTGASAPPLAIVVAIALSACLILGFADRLAAVALAAMCVSPLLPLADGASPRFFVFLLLAHAFTPGRPYGSLAARGRSDPGGGWRMPDWILHATWVALLAMYAYGAHVWLQSPVAPSFANVSPGFLLLHVLAFNPAWLKPVRDAEPALLFYDGACGLCHAAVRFILAEDRDGRGFVFAPLASERFESAVSANVRTTLPDSLVLLCPDGTLLLRSAAVREICVRLGGLWRALASASRVIPVALQDRIYDFVAHIRARLFAKPDDACPLLPAELRARFTLPPAH